MIEKFLKATNLREGAQMTKVRGVATEQQDSTDSMTSRATGALLCAVLAAAAWVSLMSRPYKPPEVVPASAPPTEFSAERAREHLREITRCPRPVGSVAHAETRAYLVESLEALGLETQVQHATGLGRSGATLSAARVSNVVARLSGAASSGAVVLASHYDTVPHSPGAADAGNGVAAILETVRALHAGPRLDNDVIVLITDAEEPGLLGAQAFVEEHPWAGEIGLVLNAEGRGNRGPVAMFRTTDGNGKMIRTLARAVPTALAESMTNDAFRYMPNDTDLSVFQRAGFGGMDFANAHGLTHYHTPLDTFAAASPETLQHHGNYMLSLAQAFAQMDLQDLAAPNRVYFSAPVVGLIHYPVAWALPLTLLTLVVGFVAGVLARRSAELSFRPVGASFLHFIAALVLLPLLAIAGWRLVSGMVPEVAWFSDGIAYESGRYLLGFCLLAASAYMASMAWLDRRASSGSVALAPVVVWSLLAVVTTLWLPGASYLFLWPLLISAVVLVLLQLRVTRHTFVRGAVLALSGAVILVMVLPAVEAMGVMLSMNAVAVPLVLLVLALGLINSQLAFISRATGHAVPILLALSGVAVLAVAVLDAGFDDQRRKPNSLNYIADVDENEAWWYSLDRQPDDWTRRYLGPAPDQAPLPDWAPEHPFGFTNTPWISQAEDVVGTAPNAEVLEEAVNGNERRLRLRLSSPQGAYVMVIRFAGDADVRDLQVDGRRPAPGVADAAGGNEPLEQIYYFGMPRQGAELVFTASSDALLGVYLRSNIPGLPPPEHDVDATRPRHMMIGGSNWSDMTQVQRRLEL